MPCTGWCTGAGMVPGGYRGRYTGWVIPGSSTSEEPTQHVPAKRARRPCRGRSGGDMRAGWAGPVPPLRGPVGVPAGPSLYRTLAIPASGPIRARFYDISLKVSQNGQVSPRNVEKASHSPYIQNELRKSALGILRFPFSSAFSHKELLGHFDASTGIIVKTTKCRPDVHTPYPPDVTRSERQIPPRCTTASCLLCTAPHLA